MRVSGLEYCWEGEDESGSVGSWLWMLDEGNMGGLN